MDEELLRIFPLNISNILSNISSLEKLQEIRVKVNKPIILIFNSGERILNYDFTKEDMKSMLQRISNYSLYAYEEQIRQGFITIKGGHRIGLAGEFVLENGNVKTIKNISSLNIRICREVKGCSNKIIKKIINNNEVCNTLIISPPKCGKTTMLRDIARNLSNGMADLKLKGKKVVVVDERSEIGGAYLGVPQMDLGIRTDLLDNCTKREGMMLAIRSLSPEVIICDEIGTLGDIDALLMAFNSGVNIIVTVHGYDIEDIYKREVFRELLSNNILERIVVLSTRQGVGTVENIYEIGGETLDEHF